MGTHPSTNTFRGTNRGNAPGRGGSTHSPKAVTGTAPLGTSSTHPTSGAKMKQGSASSGDEKHHR